MIQTATLRAIHIKILDNLESADKRNNGYLSAYNGRFTIQRLNEAKGWYSMIKSLYKLQANNDHAYTWFEILDNTSYVRIRASRLWHKYYANAARWQGKFERYMSNWYNNMRRRLQDAGLITATCSSGRQYKYKLTQLSKDLVAEVERVLRR